MSHRNGPERRRADTAVPVVRAPQSKPEPFAPKPIPALAFWTPAAKKRDQCLSASERPGAEDDCYPSMHEPMMGAIESSRHKSGTPGVNVVAGKERQGVVDSAG